MERDVVLGVWDDASEGANVTPKSNIIDDFVRRTVDVRAVERAAELCPDAQVVLDEELRICWPECGSAERAGKEACEPTGRFPDDPNVEDNC